MNDQKLNILIIDGSQEVLDLLIKELSFNTFVHITTYRIYHCENTREKSLDRCSAEIAGLIARGNFHVIIANRDIYEFDADQLSVNVHFDVIELLSGEENIFGKFNIGESVVAGIRKIIIRTFDPQLYWEIIRDLESAVNQVFDREIAFIIELSSAYVKYGESLQRNPAFLPLTEQGRIEYERNFAGILYKIIEEIRNEKGDVHTFSEQFDALEKIKSLNRDNFEIIRKLKSTDSDLLAAVLRASPVLNEINQLIDYSIGHVTYISNIKYNKETHLLDIPYKDYYEEINPELENKLSWSAIYKTTSDEFLKDQYCYFNYIYENRTFKISDFYSSDALAKPDKKEAFIKFLPFLHSSIFYDATAWKVQRESVILVDQGACPDNSLKLFFLFSKVENRVFTEVSKMSSLLNFSFWINNKKRYNKTEVAQTIKRMRDNYFLNIKDAIQSSVIMSVFDHVSQLNEDKNKIQVFKDIAEDRLNFISSHKHTIRNFGYERRLANLKKAINKNNLAMARQILTAIEKLNLLRDITIDFIYKNDEPVAKLLLHKKLKELGFTYSAILKIINDGETNQEQFLETGEDVYNHPANTTGENEIIDVFNLLVNLYSNALKYSKGLQGFKVSLLIESNTLVITFFNNKKMDEDVIRFLKVAEATNPSDTTGIEIIKKSVKILSPFLTLEISTDTDHTAASLKINPR